MTGNAQPAAFNRQIAMYLANRVGGWSVTKIGKFYNGCHHTTVCYAIRRIVALRSVNADVNGLLTVLTEEIQSGLVREPSQRLSLKRLAEPRGFCHNGRVRECLGRTHNRDDNVET
jgi:hypothetical protein